MKRMIGTNTYNWWVSFTRAFAFEIYYNLKRFFCVNSPQNQGGLPPKIWFECWNIMPHTHQEDVKRFPITWWGFLEKARCLPSSSKNKLEKAGKIHVLERSTWLHLLNIIKISISILRQYIPASSEAKNRLIPALSFSKVIRMRLKLLTRLWAITEKPIKPAPKASRAAWKSLLPLRML